MECEQGRLPKRLPKEFWKYMAATTSSRTTVDACKRMLMLFVLAIPPTRIIMEAYDMRIIIYRSFRKVFGVLKYSAMVRRCAAAPTMPVSIKASCQSGLRKYATFVWKMP